MQRLPDELWRHVASFSETWRDAVVLDISAGAARRRRLGLLRDASLVLDVLLREHGRAEAVAAAVALPSVDEGTILCAIEALSKVPPREHAPPRPVHFEREPVFVAARLGRAWVLRSLLEFRNEDADRPSLGVLGRALLAASAAGHAEAVAEIVEASPAALRFEAQHHSEVPGWDDRDYPTFFLRIKPCPRERRWMEADLGLGRIHDFDGQGGLTGVTPLMLAALHGRSEVIELLIAAGAAVHPQMCVDGLEHFSALGLAAAGQHFEVALQLLAAGAGDYTALKAAIRARSSEMLFLLHSVGGVEDDPAVSPYVCNALGEAVRAGDLGAARLLLGRRTGAENELRVHVANLVRRGGMTPEAYVFLGGELGVDMRPHDAGIAERATDADVASVRALLGAGACASRMLVGAASRASGNAAVVDLLLDAGADKDVGGDGDAPALVLAARSGNEHAARRLLAAGAEADERTCFGGTALHDADAAVARVLIGAGADADARDFVGRTPLHRAVEALDVGKLDTLLSVGADVDAADAAGRTPLHYLGLPGVPPTRTRAGPVAVAQGLLAAGADVGATDHGGSTALQLILAAVESRGARDRKAAAELKEVASTLFLRGAALAAPETPGRAGDPFETLGGKAAAWRPPRLSFAEWYSQPQNKRMRS